MCHVSVSIHSVKKMEATMQAKNTRASANVLYIFYTMLLSGVVMIVLYWMICHFLSRTSQSHRERRNSSKNTSSHKKSISNAVPSFLASKHENNGKRVKSKKKRDIQEFTHHWKLATLKGHTGPVYNISVSSNGKYVASCAEDNALREHHDEFPGKQSFQRDEKIRKRKKKQKMGLPNKLVCNTQRNENIEENGGSSRRSTEVRPPLDSMLFCLFRQDRPDGPILRIPLENYGRNISRSKKNDCVDIVNPPGNDYMSERLNIKRKDSDVANMMSIHVLSLQDLYNYGYPTICMNHVEIFHTPYPMVTNAGSGHDSGQGSSSTEHSDQEQENLSSDSAKGSDSEKNSDNEKSTDSGKDSDNDKSSDSEKNDELPTNEQASALHTLRTCVRCQKDFFVDENGKYVYGERCYYHWGKLRTRNGTLNDNYWTCCDQRQRSKPCATAKLHVWTGLVPGTNGPYNDFVRTSRLETRRRSPEYHDGVYGLDCEMCFTRNGLELTRVSLVNMYGQVVYDTLVKPETEIIDYNSRFSGITERDLENVTKTLADVQADLLQLINANTILVGHGLDSDLRVLRLLHQKIVDTSILFSHDLGFPYRQSLKMMALKVLKKKIQESTHDSVEDSRTAMDLVMRQLQHDFSQYKNSKIAKQDLRDISSEEERKRIQGDFKEIVKMRAAK